MASICSSTAPASSATLNSPSRFISAITGKETIFSCAVSPRDATVGVGGMPSSAGELTRLVLVLRPTDRLDAERRLTTPQTNAASRPATIGAIIRSLDERLNALALIFIENFSRVGQRLAPGSQK